MKKPEVLALKKLKYRPEDGQWYGYLTPMEIRYVIKNGFEFTYNHDMYVKWNDEAIAKGVSHNNTVWMKKVSHEKLEYKTGEKIRELDVVRNAEASGYIRSIGQDKQGNAIIYVVFTRDKDTDPNFIIKKTSYKLDQFKNEFIRIAPKRTK